MVNNVLFSSKSDEWSTPPDIYEELDKEFNFTLDPCSTKYNHKCIKYFTAEDDGLSRSWGGRGCSVTLRTLIYLSGLRKHGRRALRIIL